MLDHRKCTEECRGHEEADSPCILACVNDDAGHRYSLRQNCLDMPRHAPAALREDELTSQPNVITAALAADRERGKFAVIAEAARDLPPRHRVGRAGRGRERAAASAKPESRRGPRRRGPPRRRANPPPPKDAAERRSRIASGVDRWH